MNKSALVSVVLAAMILLGVGLLLYSTRPWDTGGPKLNPEDIQAAADLKYVNETDKYNLEYDDQASIGELTKAFRRLGNQADPKLKDYIQRYKDHDSIPLRAAVVEAAGTFPEYRFLVIKALESPEQRIRLAAVKGLGRRGDKPSKDILLEHLQKKETSYAERVEAHKSLVRVAQSDEERENNIQALISVLRSVPKERAEPVALDLFKLAPRHSDVLSIAKATAQGEQNNLQGGVVRSRAIQYTAAFDKDWLQSVFGKLPMLKEGTYQRVMLDMIRAHCFSGARGHLESIKQDPSDPGVAKLANEVVCQ